jgi:hypothetical protein
MLTKKQMWRKTKAISNYSFIPDEPQFKITSKNSYSTTEPSSVSDLDNSCNGDNNNSSKKYVKFSTLVKVCLIPTRAELSHLFPELYWTKNQCNDFKNDALAEIKDFVEKEDCSMKLAVQQLYQPGQEPELENLNHDLVISPINLTNKRTPSEDQPSSSASAKSREPEGSAAESITVAAKADGLFRYGKTYLELVNSLRPSATHTTHRPAWETVWLQPGDRDAVLSNILISV